jgi:DNA polymerase-2
MLIKKEPLEKVPRLPMYISHAHKGLIPLAIKPLLDRRMEYKRNPTALNIRRAKGIKHVLVTAYGYSRFREFKLGTASSHMAICSYAREIILEANKLAEEKGFTIVHGIVDSLFLKKKGMTKKDVTDFIKDLELLFGMPISYEGTFKWIVFLPSINDYYRPLPSTYYGVYDTGEIKARGIEMRQKGKPLIVRYYQKRIIEEFAKCNSKKEIIAKIPECARKIREIIKNIGQYEKELFVHKIILSKTDYKHNNVQKQIVTRLKLRGIIPLPGQTIFYIMGRNGAILPEEYDGKPDLKYYEKILERSLFNIIQPFGIRMKEQTTKEKQTKITDYTTIIKQVGIPFDTTLPRLKLSEKIIRKKLEKQGYQVWRGGAINILSEQDIYPNVRKKYELLYSLLDKHHPNKLDELKYLCYVHHGMPDFLTFKDGKFKFIECKLGYEQLLPGQKKCITKLQNLGFEVELYKLIEPQTKAIITEYNVNSGVKTILETQEKIAITH